MKTRRKKIILTEAQIQEYRRKNKNHNNRRKYKLKQIKLFFAEYRKICKKYGCFVQSFYGSQISKQQRGEKLYTINSHLKSIKPRD